MATTEERDIFAEEILGPVGRNADRLGDGEVTGFLAMKGELYDQDLMVVGRAVNGWTKDIAPQKMAEASALEKYAEAVLDGVTKNGGCPMRWVTDCWGSSNGGYNTARSAFWRVIRTVVGELRIADVEEDCWSSYLVWSNLYKVSPASGGNPGSKLCDIQFPGCVSLLDMELLTYRPRRLLLLTGLNWAERFLQQVCPGFSRVSNSYVEAIGQINFASGIQTKVVVAVHPQAKQEGRWVKDVMDGFQM